MKISQLLNETMTFKNGYKLGDPFPGEVELDDEASGVEVEPIIISDLDDGEGKDSKETVSSWNQKAKKLLKLKHLSDDDDPIDEVQKLLDETESTHTFGVETYNGWFIRPDDTDLDTLDEGIRYVLKLISVKTEIMLHTPGYFSET